jgi:hypothetical protein
LQRISGAENKTIYVIRLRLTIKLLSNLIAVTVLRSLNLVTMEFYDCGR